MYFKKSGADVGTNYYLKIPASNKCKCCEREDPESFYHIGKNSGGWKFGFHPKFRSWSEWYRFIVDKHKVGGFIQDEYGVHKSLADFIELVENAQKGIWLYHTGYDTKRERDNPYEFLDPKGYRFINCQEFT